MSTPVSAASQQYDEACAGLRRVKPAPEHIGAISADRLSPYGNPRVFKNSAVRPGVLAVEQRALDHAK